MPLREFECQACNVQGELLHPSTDPTMVPAPDCPRCQAPMSLMWSLCKIDSSDHFSGKQIYTGPDGRVWNIDNLHKLRQVEHAYQATGHDVRFDAYSANPSNPNAVDGFGLEYWDGDKSKKSSTREIISLGS